MQPHVLTNYDKKNSNYIVFNRKLFCHYIYRIGQGKKNNTEIVFDDVIT